MRLAQVFPVDTTSQMLVSDLRGDLIEWGVALIGALLFLYAYDRLSTMLHGDVMREAEEYIKRKGWDDPMWEGYRGKD